MTQTIKITLTSDFQKIADGPTTLVLNQIQGVSDLVIKGDPSVPPNTYSNTFMLKSGVIDGSFTLEVGADSYVFIKAVAGNPAILSYIKD